jgi:formiminotetrahydrofolate cyclodeaminase
MADAPLVSRSVREFVASVASAAEPVPAGGSVAALTGAASAALLALVCHVLERHDAEGITVLEARASLLQQRLLTLVDEDAQAFHAFLETKRSGGDTRDVVARASRTPLDIGAACAQVVELSHQVERVARLGAILGDVRAARHLAQAALMSALDLAEGNISLQPDVQQQHALRAEIAGLRRGQAG